jgi:hypothetical protein
MNQSAANQRAQNVTVQDINDQTQSRQKANDLVKQQAQSIANSDPQAVAAKETGDFVKTLRSNQAGSAAGGATNTNPTNFGAPVSALNPTAGASSRYKSDSATSQKQIQDYGNTNAAEMGAVDSAVRQRQNEGLNMQTLGANLQQLQTQAYQNHFVNQIRASAAGQTNPWVSLFSNAVGGAGSTMSKNGWFTSAPPSTTGNILGNGTINGSLPGDASQIPGPSPYGPVFKP